MRLAILQDMFRILREAFQRQVFPNNTLRDMASYYRHSCGFAHFAKFLLNRIQFSGVLRLWTGKRQEVLASASIVKHISVSTYLSELFLLFQRIFHDVNHRYYYKNNYTILNYQPYYSCGSRPCGLRLGVFADLVKTPRQQVCERAFVRHPFRLMIKTQRDTHLNIWNLPLGAVFYNNLLLFPTYSVFSLGCPDCEPSQDSILHIYLQSLLSASKFHC